MLHYRIYDRWPAFEPPLFLSGNWSLPWVARSYSLSTQGSPCGCLYVGVGVYGMSNPYGCPAGSAIRPQKMKRPCYGGRVSLTPSEGLIYNLSVVELAGLPRFRVTGVQCP